MTEPVAQRHQPAQRPDVGRGERHARIGRAQLGGGEVEHEVVRADGHDRAVDRAELAQQPHLDLLARVVALERGGHHEQAVGAHERGQHPGPARERRGHQLAADPPEPHAHPVVHAHRRGELARQPRAHARPLGRREPLQGGQQRQREDLERQRRRHREAGGPDHRRRVDRAEHDRVAGLDRDAVHGERAEPLDDRRRVVVAARARAGDDDHQVAARGRRPHGGRDAVGVVGLDRRYLRHAARLARLRREHQRVGVEHLAGTDVGPDRPYSSPVGITHLVAGGDDGDDRPPATTGRRGRAGSPGPPRRPPRPRPARAAAPPAAAARWR